MRNNPNKVVRVITTDGPQWWMFITGKMLAFYVALFRTSYRDKYDRITYELHGVGQAKDIRYFCDKKELDNLMDDRKTTEGKANG